MWSNFVMWSRGEREFPFPTIPGITGVLFPFPKIGNDFFIPVPVPKSWDWHFSVLFPITKFGNAIFRSHSRYREWIIKVGNKNGNCVQKVRRRRLLTDKINLLNPLKFLYLYIIQFAISNITFLASGYIMVNETQGNSHP